MKCGPWKDDVIEVWEKYLPNIDLDRKPAISENVQEERVEEEGGNGLDYLTLKDGENQEQSPVHQTQG